MAITVKTMKRPEQDVSYLRATLKGMALTFGHLFRKSVTMASSSCALKKFLRSTAP